MGILSCMGTVRGMAASAINGGIALVDCVFGHVTHSSGHSRRIVTGPAHSLLCSIVRVEVAPAQGVTVIAANPAALIVLDHQGDGWTGRQHNHS